MLSLGLAQLIATMAIGASGIPLGIPPGPEDAALLRVSLGRLSVLHELGRHRLARS